MQIELRGVERLCRTVEAEARGTRPHRDAVAVVKPGVRADQLAEHVEDERMVDQVPKGLVPGEQIGLEAKSLFHDRLARRVDALALDRLPQPDRVGRIECVLKEEEPRHVEPIASDR
jgi:hypothetical protein